MTYTGLVHEYRARDKYGRSMTVLEQMTHRVHPAVVVTMPKRYREDHPDQAYLVNLRDSDLRDDRTSAPHWFSTRRAALAWAREAFRALPSNVPARVAH